MTKAVEDQLEELKNRLDALQQLLLAHIIAADALDRTLGDDTMKMALFRLDQIRGSQPVAANFLDALVEELIRFRIVVDRMEMRVAAGARQ